MLALLFASLFLTAVIVQKTYTPKNNLYQTAQTLENNLHKKEAFVNQTLTDKASFEKLKSLEDNDREALSAITSFTTKQNIWFITLKEGRLAFWSGVKIIPDHPESITPGYSFIHEYNGYYDVIRKNEGSFSAIFFIPVKLDYPFQNQYLQNVFAANLLTDNNIQIADYNDKNIYEIHSIDHTYLFSVKVNPHQVSHKFFLFETVVWLLCALVLGLFMHNICNYIATRGYVYLSFLILATVIIGVRAINLQYNLPDFVYRPRIFDPALYSSNSIFPSLGDLCINILCASWFFAFVYRFKDKLIKHTSNRLAGYSIVVTAILVLIIVAHVLLSLFYGLVTTSSINFDVNNVLNLSGFSVLGVLMLCFAFLIFYLLVETCLTVTFKTDIPASHQLALLMTGIAIATLIVSYRMGEFTSFYILWMIWVIIRGYAYYYEDGRTNSISLVSLIVICAVISAIKLNHFQSIKEIALRKDLVQKLENPDDVRADRIFKKIEKQIIVDNFIKKYYTDSAHSGTYLKTYLQKKYFDGYLAKYDISIHEYDGQDVQFPSEKKYDLNIFKDMVVLGAYKVSDHFYRFSRSFGYQDYFALLPFYQGDKYLGTTVVELNSKSVKNENAFPELLIAGEAGLEDEFKNYSYAYYVDNKLADQNGKYIYSLINKEFSGKIKQYVFKNTTVLDPARYSLWTSYSHLIYKPNVRNLIVISKEENIIISAITSITFFFIVFLTFSVLVILIHWLWGRIKILYNRENYFHWVLQLNFDNILYKTRIQFSIVFAVVFTLVLVGVITYVSIVEQYNQQQDDLISEKLSRIAKAFEDGNFDVNFDHIDERFQSKFDEFASTYSADLTLFNTDGVELISTQPKFYDYGLQARRINARAYIYLNKLQKTEYINNEIVGKLTYKAAYVPIKLQQKTLGYLQLPYFANEADYKEHIGALLNAMINIYALIFIAIGLLAIIIARQITSPLNIIQYSLSKTIYGQKNEPIVWKRNDEIGALIKEYNNMIADLEQSAQKLAQSERESAWREMAKQVAHEIKNPLTPLKLGLQLLEKSWKDKDPKFDQKFERFSKSFVEQIESLSSIASEFSAFAKMPDTRIEKMDVFEVLSQAVTIFKQADNIRINYNPPETSFFINADRDQLLRCFNNLLKNAIEATPQGKTGEIEIDNLVTNKHILLSIKDNGNGIPENLREKIFEPNFTTKSSGTGLGLAFVKNSIENAGGKVWFETELNLGTTFYISLPEAEA